jgi:fatty acid desaturase
MQSDFKEIVLAIEWPTVALVAACSATWMSVVWLIGFNQLWWALPLLALPIALHSSLQHEVIHGHPTPWRWVNVLLVFPAPGLYLPFHRFEDLHVLHHHDCELGDPHGDPESPYISDEDWRTLGAASRNVRRFNNTLTGRLLIGPPVSLARLITGDVFRVLSGRWIVVWHWLAHAVALAPVLIWLNISGVPLWAYALLAAWPGMTILMLRTFAEHRWHPEVAGRSVTVDHGGVFALLFLNNHLHAAHHHSPGLAWYRLPKLSRRLDVDGQIIGERFRGYGQIARKWGVRVRTPLVLPPEASVR